MTINNFRNGKLSFLDYCTLFIEFSNFTFLKGKGPTLLRQNEQTSFIFSQVGKK